MATREIGGETFELVKTQRSGVEIFRGPMSYVRIGPRSEIERQLSLHREMERLGMPVPRLIGVGYEGDTAYFAEESLGSERFMDIFERDTKDQDSVSDDHFEQMILMAERFLRAQIASKDHERDWEEFARAVHRDVLADEMPEHADAIRARFSKHAKSLRAFPFKLMHGDFNAANMYPKGVIDFADASAGPVGYDMVTAITIEEWFPRGDSYEFQGKYRFAEGQKDRYLSRIDSVMKEHSLPSLTKALPHFEFFRAIWLTARMQEWPNLQRYRYERFVETYLRG